MANYGSYSPSYGSLVDNGQLIPVFTANGVEAFNSVGPALRGGGYAPLQTLPGGINGGQGSGSAGAGPDMAAAAQPFSFVKSPLPLMLIMLVVGVLGLRYIHWRR